MRIAILGDTHFPKRAGGELPAACVRECHAADLVVHTGDVADIHGLRALRAIGPPVVAVSGNADDAAVKAELPATAEIIVVAALVEIRDAEAIGEEAGVEARRLQHAGAMLPAARIEEVIQRRRGMPPGAGVARVGARLQIGH